CLSQCIPPPQVRPACHGLPPIYRAVGRWVPPPLVSLRDRRWPLASHWRSFVRPDQRLARASIFERSTAPPAATSEAASAQNTAGWEPRPSSSGDAPTGPTARAPFAASATAPAIVP